MTRYKKLDWVYNVLGGVIDLYYKCLYERFFFTIIIIYGDFVDESLEW